MSEVLDNPASAGQRAPGAADVRHVILLQLADETDALARILLPFAVADARLETVDLQRRPDSLAVRLDVSGVGAGRIELLTRRLQQMPVVLSVALGWRAVPS